MVLAQQQSMYLRKWFAIASLNFAPCASFEFDIGPCLCMSFKCAPYLSPWSLIMSSPSLSGADSV